MKLAADAIPDSAETIAATIAAADRRISALSRQVERCLASGAAKTAPVSVTAPLSVTPPPQPAVPMAARVQPTVTPIAGPSPSGEERARPWRPQSIAANAALAAAAAALLTFCVFSWRTTAPSPRREAQPQPVESAAPANTSQAAAAQADVTAGLTMTLVASGQCWIRAVADDAKAIERLLRAGETVQLSGENQIVLRVGDAAAVQVTINGKAVAPLGAHGEVITRRFSRADRVL